MKSVLKINNIKIVLNLSILPPLWLNISSISQRIKIKKPLLDTPPIEALSALRIIAPLMTC
jgi:hypothetical protein